jgi:actin-related protein
MGKAGFPDNGPPRSVFPSIVECLKSVQAVTGGRNKDTCIGDEACAKAGILILKSPIGHGIVMNRDIASERFRCPFSSGPSPGSGFDQALFNSITKYDIDIRKDLYANIVMSGGSTMF